MILLSSFLSPLSQELYSCSPAAAFPSAAKSFGGCQFRKEWEKRNPYLPFVPLCRCVYSAPCLHPAPSCLFLLSGYLFICLQCQNPRVARKCAMLPLKKGGQKPELDALCNRILFWPFFPLNFGYIWSCSLVRFGFEALKPSGPAAERFGGQSREETAIWPHSFAIVHDQTQPGRC